MGASSERLLRLAERADAAADPAVATLIAYAAQTQNDRAADLVEDVLAATAAQHAQYPFTGEAYPLATVPGPAQLDLGTVLHTSRRFLLDTDTLTQHVLATGITGIGKTSFLYQLLNEVETPFWAFDLKTDYRHLSQHDSDLVVIPWEQFRLNPLRPPPGVTTQRWAQALQAVIGDAYDLLSGSQHYLLPHLLDLYASHGIKPEMTVADHEHSYPALAHLQQYIAGEGATGRSQSTYKDRISSRVEAILAATNPVFACRRGYAVPDLLERNVVLELDGLAVDHQDFLMELLLIWVYTYRAAQQDRGMGLQHLFVMDEGKRAFSVYKERQDAKGLPTIDTVLAKLREFGEGVVVGDQEPAKLTTSLKANTRTKVLFPIGDHTQFEAMAGAMQLSAAQQAYASRLDTGQAIVQVGTADPVPVQFHHFDLAKTVTDEQVRCQYRATWQELRECVTPLDSADTEGYIDTGPEAATAGERPDTDAQLVQAPVETVGADTPPPESQVEESQALSASAEFMLKDVARNPFNHLTERYEQCDSLKAGIAAKNELIEQGLVREKEIRQSYGQFKVLELTAAGRAWLDEQGIAVERQGRGGIVHRYWQQQIQTALDDHGWTAVLEKHDADVYAERDGETLAVEVAMENRAREIEHAQDRLDAGIDNVVIACRTQTVQTGLTEKLAATDLSQGAVQLTQVQAFEDGNMPDI